MSKSRRHFTAEQKAQIVRRHLAGKEAVQLRKIEQLETKLTHKNEVIAELMQEHVELKKELGEL